MLSYLPEKLKSSIYKLGIEGVSEIRIRNMSPVMVIINGSKIFLDKFVLTRNDIENIVLKVCKQSIYSYEQQIKQGFITTDKGERLGLAGEFVIVNNTVSTINNFQSLCIRIPHEFVGVSKQFFTKLYKSGSVLIISPPGVGKTTFLRDFTRFLAENTLSNVVVVDERNEIACVTGEKSFYLGKTTDVLTYSNKSYGLNQAIRTLNPNVIVLDELVSIDDVNSVITTIYGGVDVVATVHANSLDKLFLRDFAKILKEVKVFDYYVVIDIKKGSRSYRFYNRDFVELCF